MSTTGPERTLGFPFLMTRADANSSDEGASQDQVLVERIRDGETDALEQLCSQYSRMLLGICFRVLQDRGEAEELVQDLFLYIFQNARLFDPLRGTVKAWIVQLAYYRALNRRLFLTRRHFYDGTDTEGLDVEGGRDPAQELSSMMGLENLETAFAELSERQAETLRLFFVEGFSLREISQRLDEPLSNIRHHYYRGIERLRQSSITTKLWGERRD